MRRFPAPVPSMRRVPAMAASLIALASAQAHAEDAPQPADDSARAFALGQIVVTAAPADGVEVSGETLNAAAIGLFNRNTLDDAINLMPGVNGSNSGGTRNERLVFVRGFDRFQVPLSIDGIRVYLPADNRLDYGRFLTPDIAQIQVAKGYASVLDGPGAIGGAINLVTSKPTRALEGDVRGTLNLGREAEYAGYTLYGRLGTAHEKWYAQVSYARNFQDHWDLSGDYKPTATSAEDGGHRGLSRSEDWRVNVKAGFTPNATDEYAISYTRQEGAKNAPLHVTDAPASQRYWSWPYWNIDSLYFLSTTALGDVATLKTRLYRNTFDNLLRSFDDAAQTKQTLGRAFNSYYADEAWGGSAELGVEVSHADHLTLAVHYRRDKHVEWQQGFPSGATEPKQTNIEDTYSIAVENRLMLTPQLTFVAGASVDWRDMKKAEEYGTPPGGGAARIFQYPHSNADGWNAQGQLVWQADADTRINASVSSRVRFPTIFERFSTQFGTAASNPALKPERATNVELGGKHRFGPVSVEGALFYSDVQDAIVAVRPAGFPSGTTQRQNLGNGTYYGAEIALNATLAETLSVGANYTYIHRDFDITPAAGVTVPLFALTGVPTHKAFLYAEWKPVPALRITPSLDIASDRKTANTAVTQYYDTGRYVLANLRADWTVRQGLQVGVGARNLFDDNYALVDGFPEPGRSFYATAGISF